MASWIEDFVIPNKFSRSQKKLLGVWGIVMHWTGDPGATDENEQKFFDGSDGGGSRYASAHIFADRDSARLIIPLNEVAYHANDHACRINKLKPNANFNTIGIEMCVEKDGTIHPETIARAVNIATDLCKKFNLDPINDIYRHFDITGKNCPAPWVKDKSKFEDFKNRVNEKVNPKKVEPPMWNGFPIKEGQIGLVVILKPINLWKRDENNKLSMVRVLNAGESYRVYGYDDLYGGQYNLGGTYVTKMEGYIKYQTPSKELIIQAQEFYKKN